MCAGMFALPAAAQDVAPPADAPAAPAAAGASAPAKAEKGRKPAAAPSGPAPQGQGQPQQGPPPQGYPPQGYPPPGYYYPVPYYVPVQEPPIRWKPGQPAPDGYHVETSPDWKTFKSGANLLVGFWLMSVLAGAALNAAEEPKEDDGDDIEKGDWSTLYWPVAGPFLTMKHTSTKEAGWALLLIDGVAQSAGVIMMGVGLAKQKEHLEPNSTARVTPRIRVAPLVHRRAVGLGLGASF